MRIYGILICFSIFVLSFSCMQSNSDIHVVRGEVIKEDQYPGVVHLFSLTEKDYKLSLAKKTYSSSLCTGSVVSHNTIITAAHCNHHLNKAIFATTDGKIKVEDTLVSKANPSFKIQQQTTEENSRFDIAVWVFKRGTFNHIKEKIQISDKTPTVGTEVRMIGYGCYTKLEKIEGGKKTICDPDREEELVKRTGVNSIKKLASGNAYVTLYSDISLVDKINGKEQKATGQNVQIAPGDSGGPLLLKSDPTKLLGVASYISNVVGDICDTYDKNSEDYWDCAYLSSTYINPISGYNKKFLEDMVDNNGAIIPGILVGVSAVEYNGKIKVLRKEAATTFNEKVETGKVIRSLNGKTYKDIASLKKDWRAINFYERSEASWSFE